MELTGIFAHTDRVKVVYCDIRSKATSSTMFLSQCMDMQVNKYRNREKSSFTVYMLSWTAVPYS